MEKIKLTDKHFCYVLFLEMQPSDFINLLKTNEIVENIKFLEINKNKELYQEAKDLILDKNYGNIIFDFDYDSEPFVFNKYIDCKLDRAYKICIFELVEKEHAIKTSNVYSEKGMPLFFDPNGDMIKNSLN